MANLVVLVVVILGLINGGYCQETAQEAPWRIHTLFSVECHNYLFRFSSILQKVVLDPYMCFYSHQFGVLRFPKYIVADLSELNSFMQQYGVSPERFGEYKELCSFFKVLTTSVDSDNKVYVSQLHAHNYPSYRHSRHPEVLSLKCFSSYLYWEFMLTSLCSRNDANLSSQCGDYANGGS
ncbi:Gamma-glutamyl hydrolase 1 [Camellia lanceoleosa]|uniref:Gamma-glutamyl hydrolase 1 n=1 Tax=Camellia lanceoleosa TaxID=1840588 RepID=A0ACC0IA15_9ERIC|nr:Gamma-glutamyl hydrolase 1 [Camellia lanceoleosa]